VIFYHANVKNDILVFNINNRVIMTSSEYISCHDVIRVHIVSWRYQSSYPFMTASEIEGPRNIQNELFKRDDIRYKCMRIYRI